MEQQNESPKIFNRLLVVGLLLALSAGNSALFYFVIWDMLSPLEPYSVILFFLSGSAHLVYFFLPWFIKAMLAPAFRRLTSEASRLDSRGGYQAGEASNGFVTVCAMVGMLLCITTIGLWSFQPDLWRQKEPTMALITEANCLAIGGAPKVIDGKLICIIEKKSINGIGLTRVSRSENRI